MPIKIGIPYEFLKMTEYSMGGFLVKFLGILKDRFRFYLMVLFGSKALN